MSVVASFFLLVFVIDYSQITHRKGREKFHAAGDLRNTGIIAFMALFS